MHVNDSKTHLTDGLSYSKLPPLSLSDYLSLIRSHSCSHSFLYDERLNSEAAKVDQSSNNHLPSILSMIFGLSSNFWKISFVAVVVAVVIVIVVVVEVVVMAVVVVGQ